MMGTGGFGSGDAHPTIHPIPANTNTTRITCFIAAYNEQKRELWSKASTRRLAPGPVRPGDLPRQAAMDAAVGSWRGPVAFSELQVEVAEVFDAVRMMSAALRSLTSGGWEWVDRTPLPYLTAS